MRALPVLLLLIVGALIAVGVNLAKAAGRYGIAGPEFAFWLSLGAFLCIAATLVISPKTVSVHVSNILAKLGATTRTEAAVKAHELGLLGILSR